MNKLERTILLFETLLNNPDPRFVDKKISEIQVSDEYVRLSSWIPTAAKTQMLEDVVERFNSIQIFAIQSYAEGLKLEAEIRDLDRRVDEFTGVNPYLANRSSREYKVTTIGDVNVEVNARGITIDDFALNKNTSRNNRRKVLMMKAFAWYREAKQTYVEIQEVAKSLIARLRASKLRFNSLNLEVFLSTCTVIGLVGFFFFLPGTVEAWRNESIGKWGYVLSGLTALVVACYCVIILCKTYYKTIAYRLQSNVKKRINNTGRLMNSLENISVKLERELAKRSKKARRIQVGIGEVSIMSRYTKNSNERILEYVYCEADYVKEHHPKTLKLMNICFAVLAIAAVAVAAIIVIL